MAGTIIKSLIDKTTLKIEEMTLKHFINIDCQFSVPEILFNIIFHSLILWNLCQCTKEFCEIKYSSNENYIKWQFYRVDTY